MTVVDVIARDSGGRRTYWIKSPLGGYMQVPKDEVDAWIDNGVAQMYLPDPDVMEKLRLQLMAQEIAEEDES